MCVCGKRCCYGATTVSYDSKCATALRSRCLRLSGERCKRGVMCVRLWLCAVCRRAGEWFNNGTAASAWWLCYVVATVQFTNLHGALRTTMRHGERRNWRSGVASNRCCNGVRCHVEPAMRKRWCVTKAATRAYAVARNGCGMRASACIMHVCCACAGGVTACDSVGLCGDGATARRCEQRRGYGVMAGGGAVAGVVVCVATAGGCVARERVVDAERATADFTAECDDNNVTNLHGAACVRHVCALRHAARRLRAYWCFCVYDGVRRSCLHGYESLYGGWRGYGDSDGVYECLRRRARNGRSTALRRAWRNGLAHTALCTAVSYDAPVGRTCD